MTLIFFLSLSYLFFFSLANIVAKGFMRDKWLSCCTRMEGETIIFCLETLKTPPNNNPAAPILVGDFKYKGLSPEKNVGLREQRTDYL